MSEFKWEERSKITAKQKRTGFKEIIDCKYPGTGWRAIAYQMGEKPWYLRIDGPESTWTTFEGPDLSELQDKSDAFYKLKVDIVADRVRKRKQFEEESLIIAKSLHFRVFWQTRFNGGYGAQLGINGDPYEDCDVEIDLGGHSTLSDEILDSDHEVEAETILALLPQATVERIASGDIKVYWNDTPVSSMKPGDSFEAEENSDS